jgi:hypothetical protein
LFGRDGPVWPAHEEEVRGNKIRERKRKTTNGLGPCGWERKNRWAAHREERDVLARNSLHSLTKRKNDLGIKSSNTYQMN